MRLIDLLKERNVTAMFTNLNRDAESAIAVTEMGVSSLMDTWFLMANLAGNGERTRTMQVVKSRGMAHSNQVREFLIGDDGVDLVEVVVENGQVLTGRLRQRYVAEAQARAGRSEQIEARSKLELQSRRLAVEASIAAAQAELLELESTQAETAVLAANAAPRQTARASTQSAWLVKTEPEWPMTPPATKKAARPASAGAGAPSRPPKGKAEWQLRLYVAGQTARSATALVNLKRLCEDHLAGRYEIEVVDLLVNPKLAAGDQILAVPTLVRLLPEPMKKIIGSLSDVERVLVGLDLHQVD